MKTCDDLTFDRIATVANMIMGLFTDQEYDHVDVVYNSFKNAGTQILEIVSGAEALKG